MRAAFLHLFYVYQRVRVLIRDALANVRKFVVIVNRLPVRPVAVILKGAVIVVVYISSTIPVLPEGEALVSHFFAA
ncbi:MAG: hypothetical protein CL862_00375 [Cyanobium sp. NAT70]|nr:hypothetical protein [Cyanobium sp. NAT70]